MNFRCAAVALGLAFATTSVTASEVNFISGNVVHNGVGCNLRLIGEIQNGDLATLVRNRVRLQKLLNERFQSDSGSLAELWASRSPVLCLNSNGGSYIEGLKIAEFLLSKSESDDFQMTTYVEAGSNCFSACALIFLAGKRIDRGGERMPARYVHVGGRVGFHAPYLDPSKMDDKQYAKTEISQSYRMAVDGINRAIELFNYRIEGGTGINEDGKPWVSGSLFVEMLSRGPNELFLIDTVGKAGRWGIGLLGIRSMRFPGNSLQKTCENTSAWEKDETKWSGPPFEEVPKGDPMFRGFLSVGAKVFRYDLARSSVFCAAMFKRDYPALSVKLLKSPVKVGEFLWEGAYDVSTWSAYPPDTAISALQ
jgi:hypothetical protein